MQVKMFAVWDDKAKAYLHPFCYPVVAQAVRAFAQSVNDRASLLCTHAEDFTLFVVADFDDSTGVVRPLDHIELVVSALQVRKASQIDELVQEGVA